MLSLKQFRYFLLNHLHSSASLEVKGLRAVFWSFLNVRPNAHNTPELAFYTEAAQKVQLQNWSRIPSSTTTFLFRQLGPASLQKALFYEAHREL